MKQPLFFIFAILFAIKISAQCPFSVSVNPNTICPGQTAMLVATGGTNYLWSNGQTNDTIYVSPLFTTLYSVTVTGAPGCPPGFLSAQVNVGTGSVANYNWTKSGNTVFFFNTSTGADKYVWSFGDGTFSTETNPTHTYTTTGDVKATLFAISCGTTCGDGQIEKTIPLGNTQPAPIANFTMSNNNGCAPMVVQFFDNSTNATSRAWSFPGGTPATSTAQNPIVTYTNAGAFFANLTVSNSVGTSSTSQPVVVNSMADMQIISSDGQVPCEPKAIVCGTTTLTLTAPGAPATSSYVWGGGGTYKSKIVTVYNNTQDVLTETFNCQVTSVDQFGNVTSTTHFFTIHVYPQMSNPIISTPTGGQVFCDEVVISCDLQEPAYTYTWYRSNNGGATWVAISGAGAELLVNELGTFLFKVKVTGPCGSKTSAPVTIIVNDCLVGNEEPDAKPEEGVIKFYPSPFTDVLNVEIAAGDYEVFFSNTYGQIIQSISVQGNFQIERGELPPGVYILEIISKGQTILVEEVVII